MKRVTADIFRRLIFESSASVWAALFFLVFGISMGAFIEAMMDPAQKTALTEYIGRYLNLSNINSANPNDIFINSLFNNLKLIAIIMVSGIFVLGFPLAFAVLAYKGISMGFSAALLIEDMNGKGILLTAVSMIPQNTVMIPVILIAVAAAVNFAFLTLKRENSRNRSYFQYLTGYICIFAVIVVATALGSFIESYICPLLMKVII